MSPPRHTEFALTADHPVFAGHFPGHPIVPGALLLDEVIRQASAWQPDTAWLVRSAKFVHPAAPDMSLSILLTPAANGLEFRIEHEAQLIAAGTLQPQAATT
ncbi:hypothetical protein [Nitrogeniibacter mangrovi]|uniref:hypothetical protein n=1 Tax=Nitrogeniibacter mangrovi TaxID=2016596 RepID=UPI001C2DB82E|nr:hypothetical protein [Nitrogeniibacter mangrovi]